MKRNIKIKNMKQKYKNFDWTDEEKVEKENKVSMPEKNTIRNSKEWYD